MPKTKLIIILSMLFIVFSGLIIFAPIYVTAVIVLWLACGIWDVMRSQPYSRSMFECYFLTKGGLITFSIAPINIILDMLSYHNHKVYKLSDYPQSWQKEISKVIKIFDDNKHEIIEFNKKGMADTNSMRTMAFYKWFDKNHNTLVPEFNQKFRYIKTIGVSNFAPTEDAPWHFGPLRLTFRILYNLSPVDTDKCYISTMGVTYYWREDPFFSFDDTLYHQSINATDAPRYCAYIDIIRPTPLIGLFNVLVSILTFIISKGQRLFYKEWKLLG